MGLFDLFGDDKKNKNKKQDSIFDLFMLNEQEKDEAKKGNYDVENFDEEDLEEDDYYFEDDE